VQSKLLPLGISDVVEFWPFWTPSLSNVNDPPPVHVGVLQFPDWYVCVALMSGRVRLDGSTVGVASAYTLLFAESLQISGEFCLTHPPTMSAVEYGVAEVPTFVLFRPW
jgi:hypothetical protein